MVYKVCTGFITSIFLITASSSSGSEPSDILASIARFFTSPQLGPSGVSLGHILPNWVGCKSRPRSGVDFWIMEIPPFSGVIMFPCNWFCPVAGLHRHDLQPSFQWQLRVLCSQLGHLNVPLALQMVLCLLQGFSPTGKSYL